MELVMEQSIQTPARNQTFQYLRTLLIIMVIDDHVSSRIGILSSIFPYNSFFMPAFIFISGYFFKQQPFLTVFKKKMKTLFVPYIIWCTIGELISFILAKANIVYWYGEINIKNIFVLLIKGPISSVTGAGWFIIMLFHLVLIYSLLRNTIFPDNRIADTVLLISSIALGMLSLYMCMRGYNNTFYKISFFRLLFYFQFYHIGYMFKKYWEPIIQRGNKLLICSACIICNVILICHFGDRLKFSATSEMKSFHSCYLPLITSVTAILFWYIAMDFLASKIKKNKVIDFIANNTFTIVMTHLFFLNIPNFYVFFKVKSGSTSYADFDVSLFQSSAWYRYSPNTKLVGFFFGFAGSILLSFLIVKAKKKLSEFKAPFSMRIKS